MTPIATRCSIAVLLVLAAGQVGAAPAASPAPGGYTSAKQCASCHRTIHKYWSESEHARAATSPLFLSTLGQAVSGAADPAAARRECVWCHAPTALVSGDWALEGALAREGVSCDFCHTVADVDLRRGGGHPFELAPGRVKRGPMEFARTGAHESAYSLLHRSSALLCASCHEYKNGNGVAVLSTYGEWMGGPHASRGETCQECHMPLVPGDTVLETLKPTQRRINLHRITGGTTPSRVENGLDLSFGAVAIGADSADVEVVVTNTGVGHSAPGGLSTKSLVLSVGVDTGSADLTHRMERVYRRELKDRDGKVLAGVSDLFLKAASVGEDTRLKQKEARRERFTVPLPAAWKAVVARLEYRDASDPASPKTRLVTEKRRERGR
jgi:hypothetical protein